jgi:RNase H-like domain found in reverse transcriptase/Integrase zinc binding domain/Chromo (CHRromatin Organisation MOdifier) domain
MSWPMPDQEELVHSVARSSNGSYFDLISAFDQTRNDPRDEKYATIINHMGVFIQKTIQQGDKNAVATHQHSMHFHLGPRWGKNVTVYVDDGTIYDERPGMSLYDHYVVCREVLLLLRKHEFYLSRKKTHFFVDMVNEGMDVLGRHVQNGEISIAKAKVDAFLALQSPTSFQELGKDLGTFTWLTDHLPFASSIAAPLHTLYHSGRWEWTESHENAFQQMKQIVGGHEVLVPLDLGPDAPTIRVVTDVSLAGTGGYICQGKTLEDSRPAVYHSRVFTPSQSNYPVHEQELLALEDIIKSYEHWLLGRPFTAVTDSQAMLSLLKQKHLSPQQWRSVIYLSKFNITFEFIEGKKNIIADLLSRIAERSTYKRDLPFLKESDAHIAAMQLRRGKVLPEPEHKASSKPSEPSNTANTTANTTANSTTDEPSPSSSMTTFSIAKYKDLIIEGYKGDTQFKMALKAGVESGVYVVKDGLLYTGPDRNQLCIPDIKVKGGRDGGTKSLREMLIAHSHEIEGHLATFKTVRPLRKEYYWKSMISDTHKYVKSCHSCQTRKTAPTKQYGKNHPLPIPTGPWQIVSMDFLVNLPSSVLDKRKYNSLYVVQDLLTKMVHLIPTTTNVKAEGVAKLYFEYIYCLHGLPKGIVSDRDTKFTGAFWRTLQKIIGTDLLMSTTDHPQTDGQTERTNRTVLQILRHFVNTNGSDWAQHLPTVEFAINSAISNSTGHAPFELVYGYLPRTFPPIVFDEDNPASMNFLEDRMLSQMSAQDAIIAAKTEQSHHVNMGQKEDPNFEVGELVLVSNESQLQHLPKGRQKLAIKYVGPYKITNVDRDTSNYVLDIQDSQRHPNFHVRLLRKYTEPNLELFPNRQRRQPRISPAEQDLNIEIEKIIGHERRRNGVIRFLCKWEGYPNEDSTFREAEKFKSSPYGIKVVKDYLLGFGEPPEVLVTWVQRTEWLKDVEKEWKRRNEEGSESLKNPTSSSKEGRM